MYVTSVSKVEENEMNVKGARGVKVKCLLRECVGAKRLQLRLFSIDVGGYTPLENISTNMKFSYFMEKPLFEEEMLKPS